MNAPSSIVVMALGLTLAACAPNQVFPSQVMEGIDTHFDFAAWRMMPNASLGKQVQLGGRIVQANPNDRGAVIIVTQLSIVERPVYGPTDTGKRSGEFAISYSGHLDLKWLAPGNRLIAIGTTQQAHAVVVDDVQRNLPSLEADCLHIWRTQGKEIGEFPYNTGGGYEPLEEETFCAAKT